MSSVMICVNSIDTTGILLLSSSLEGSLCPEGEFDCGGGDCISETWLCDFETDCENGRDELPSQCGGKMTESDITNIALYSFLYVFYSSLYPKDID